MQSPLSEFLMRVFRRKWNNKAAWLAEQNPHLPVVHKTEETTVPQLKAALEREEIAKEIVVEGGRLGIRIENAKPIIHFSGEIDLYTANDFKTAINELIASGAPNIFINITDVTFIDASGYGELIKALQQHRGVNSTNGKLILIGPSLNIARKLQITRLNRVFPIYETMQDAEESLMASQ